MFDILVGAGLALLAVRGWRRGLIREAMDFVGLVVGVIIAFRTSSYTGPIAESLFGVSPQVGRFIAGTVVFIAVGVVAAITARALGKVWSLPGLKLSNKVGGAALASAWGLFTATLVFSLLAVAPDAGLFGSAVESSTTVRVFTDPDGMPQRVFTSLSGDRIIGTVLQIRDAVGVNRAVIEGSDSLSLPPATPDQLTVDVDAATALEQMVNLERVQAGVDPLAPAAALDGVALAHATDMYRGGYFSHVGPTSGDVADRLRAAGIVYRAAGENLALAATPEGVHAGLMDSAGHRANILDADYRRIGVAVVAGPLGLMTVQVFTG